MKKGNKLMECKIKIPRSSEREYRQTSNRQTDRKTHAYTHAHTDRQTDRQIDKQADRQIKPTKMGLLY